MDAKGSLGTGVASNGADVALMHHPTARPYFRTRWTLVYASGWATPGCPSPASAHSSTRRRSTAHGPGTCPRWAWSVMLISLRYLRFRIICSVADRPQIAGGDP